MQRRYRIEVANDWLHDSELNKSQKVAKSWEKQR